MSTITPPSRNLALDGTLIGLLTLFKDKILQNMDDMLPAQVIKYDRATNRVAVQPLVVMVTTAGTQIKRGQLASIPVFQPGGGGFVISTPLQTGDLGWIKANDRDITFFLKNYQESAPNTARKHTFSDAVFIPDSFMRNVVISDDDASNLVIQKADGTVKISLGIDTITITAPNIVFKAENNILMDTPLVTIAGAIEGGTNPSYAHTAQFNGDISTTGEIEADTDVIGNGISLKHHVHSGVTAGGSNTGQPV